MTEHIPPSRWAAAGNANDGYATHFAQLIRDGHDVDGEARLADAMLERESVVLDAGAGMGRVAAALSARGHHVTAIDPDEALAAQARATFPGLDVLPLDILELTPQTLAAHGAPTAYDLVVAVGNVMIFLAEGTEREALSRFRDVLRPDGRVLIGYHLAGAPPTAGHYRPDDVIADANAVGLSVDLRLGGYDLTPPNESYAVWVLRRTH